MTIGNGALYPGAGVQKNLPPVGDIHITGIVNTAGIMEHLTLQTTRLSTVVALADVIAGGAEILAEAYFSASDPHSDIRIRSAACSCIKSFHDFMQSL